MSQRLFVPALLGLLPLLGSGCGSNSFLSGNLQRPATTASGSRTPGPDAPGGTSQVTLAIGGMH